MEAHEYDTRRISSDPGQDAIYRPPVETKTTDTAVLTLENVPMTVWNTDETRTWLQAVLNDTEETEAVKVMVVGALMGKLTTDVERSSSNSSSSSIDAAKSRAIISLSSGGDSRAKMFKGTNQLGRVRSSSEDFGAYCPGKRLACSNISKILTEAMIDKEIVERLGNRIHAAICTRGKYGVNQITNQRNHDYEAKRLRIERSGPLGDRRQRAMSFPDNDIQLSTSFNVAPTSDAPSAVDEFLMMSESSSSVPLASQPSLESMQPLRRIDSFPSGAPKKISSSVPLATLNQKPVPASTDQPVAIGGSTSSIPSSNTQEKTDEAPVKKAKTKKPKIVIS